MTKLLGIGLLFQIAVCAVVGLRLVRLALRTRQSPEGFLGAAFLLLGAVGYPISIVARSGALGELSEAALLAALAVQSTAAICMGAATWRTFYPDLGGLAWGFLVSGVLVASSLIGSAASGTPDSGAAYWLGFAVRITAFSWAAFESSRYYARLRRQRRLGLGDAVVTDRFRLWTISTVTIVVGFVVFLTARVLGLDVSSHPVVLAVTSVVGLVGGSTMWLVFFPPAAYLRRFEGEALAPGMAPEQRTARP